MAKADKKTKKNLQPGITLRSQSGFAKLTIKPYSAKDAKEIVRELQELAKSIMGMTDLTKVGECPCPDCQEEEQRARILGAGSLVIAKGALDNDAGREELAQEISRMMAEVLAKK